MQIAVLKERAFKGIGEGPFWDEDSSMVYFVDFDNDGGGRILKWDGINMHEAKHKGPATFVIPTSNSTPEKEEFIIAERQAIGITKWNQERPDFLSSVESGMPTRINDGKCDSAGRLWTGTMSLEKCPGEILHRHYGTLYSYCDLEKKIVARQDQITLSNGIAWNKEDNKLYFADSIERLVYVFDFDSKTGEVSKKKIFFDLNPLDQDAYGLPDGCAMDTDDHLWLALFGAGKVIRINTKTAQITDELNFPAKMTTSVCFGGKDLDEMYVTSAAIGLDEEGFKNQPMAGALFKVTGLGVQGIKVMKYKRN